MPFKNGKHLCACEICECGKHKCSFRTINDTPMADSTTYNTTFIPHKGEMVKSCKPQPHFLQLDKPLSDQTTNRLDFVPHDAEPPVRHKPDPYIPPEGEMESTTMYRNEFTDKKIERRKPFGKDSRRRHPGKFEGENTYKLDFRRWDMPKRELAKCKDIYTPPTDPFIGLPTYRSDFIPHEINMVQSCKPAFSMLRSTAPLEDITDYRQSFVPHPIPPRFVKESPGWAEPSQPFETLTTNQKDFTPKEGGRLPSCKPTHTFMQSDKPLQSDTTQRTDYVNHDMPKPPRHNPDPYEAPEGDIDLTTTYNKDFPTHPYAKMEAFKPKEFRRSVQPFDGRTDYRENFRRWEAARRESMAPKTNFALPDMPFDGISTNRAHFIQHEPCRLQSFKPTTSVLTSTKPLESDTIYRMEYAPKALDPCPGALLGSKSSNYALVEEDVSGHKYFEPLPGVVPVKDPRRTAKA